MRSVINHLIQLQELILIRDEQRGLPDGGSNLERLNEGIYTMTEALPQEIKSSYQRLHKRDHIVIAPLSGNNCSMCGLRLGSSVVQEVRFCRTLQACPNCTRFLYDSMGPKWVGEPQTKRGVSDRKAGIARFSSPSLMLSNMEATTKEEAIQVLAAAMEKDRFIDSADKMVKVALERESIMSTNVGQGLAFPHVRGVEGGGLAVALGTSREGIIFDGPDSEPCHFIFFSTIPTAVSAFYLKLMAGITEAYRKDPSREATLKADNPEQLWKALTRATRYTVR